MPDAPRSQTSRLEGFSDSVFATIITIMVLQLQSPDGTSFAALREQSTVFLAYVLSFPYIAIHWYDHHRLLEAATIFNRKIVMANMGLLFSLSFVPFATRWMGESDGAWAPIAVYAVTLIATVLMYYFLRFILKRNEGDHPNLNMSWAEIWRVVSSLTLYACAAFTAAWDARISYLLFLTVSVLWVIPDRWLNRVKL
jgi:uncharacterized membrane protein